MAVRSHFGHQRVEISPATCHAELSGPKFGGWGPILVTLANTFRSSEYESQRRVGGSSPVSGHRSNAVLLLCVMCRLACDCTAFSAGWRERCVCAVNTPRARAAAPPRRLAA
ncbi:hypothetical protein EVAR_3983_1 [Eumeta japonica]|uniref:Uncharacterized protein n=1 Tax=Eumeta variegata TaxID=151549 RepID=A0A4C1SR77_EUMVA|nr:hypothetical protein EVAR_3983_1 [Eumeta japonica]